MPDYSHPSNTSQQDQALVSVVMCTYNGSKYIGQQLDSICRQSYTNIEIIIADDKSTDDSFFFLKKFAEKDKRIRLYQNENNLGYTKNFSKACSLAGGQFIAIADQDDVWHPDKITLIMKSWISGVSLMYCDSARFTGDEIPRNAKPNSGYRRFEGTDSRKLAIFNTISGHALIVKKEFIQQLLPFPDNLMYDWWVGAVAACTGGVGYIPKTLVYQRIHGLNACVGKGFDHKDKRYKAVFNRMVNTHLEMFKNILAMPEKDKRFYTELLMLWGDVFYKKFSVRLFMFLLRNRHFIFWYKRKKIALFSHIKHSYLLSRNWPVI